jgi:predicted PurR-regulated permease PerM
MKSEKAAAAPSTRASASSRTRVEIAGVPRVGASRPAPASGRLWWRVVAALVLLWLAWQLRQPLLLLFGAVLVAVALDVLAQPLQRIGLGQRISVLLTVLALVALAGVGLWGLGQPLSEQLQGLRGTVPKAWQALHDWLQGTPLGRQALHWIDGLRDMELPLAGIAGMASRAAAALTAVALIVVAGVYLAVDLSQYRRGLLSLAPPARRARFARTLDATGSALSRWLLGQLVLMATIGGVVAVGLSLLEMPLALALGLIASLLEFVPFFGPIASGLLAVLVAFAQGPTQALYVALLFVAVQQVEGSLLVPLIQRWTVSLPPVLGLSAVVVFGSLFGPLGVLFGTPLMVVIMVIVQRVYVDGLLEPGQ